jgi:hypothetical protein
MTTNAIADARPLTRSGHCFLSGAEELGTTLQSFLAEFSTSGIDVGQPVSVGFALKSALEYLSTAVDGKFPTRFLLLQTRGPHTLVFNNAWRSHGWLELAYPLTKKLQTDDTYFLLQPNTIRTTDGQTRGQYGALQLIRIASGRLLRSLSLVNDGGRWVFTASGDAAVFEKPEVHQAAKVRDRFTEALLQEYLNAMGLFPFQDDFYLVNREHPAIGISMSMSGTRQPDRFPPITLKEIDARYGSFR